MPLLRKKNNDLPSEYVSLGWGGQMIDSYDQGLALSPKTGQLFNEPFITKDIPEHRPNRLLERLDPLGKENFDATRERIKSKIKSNADTIAVTTAITALLTAAVASSIATSKGLSVNDGTEGLNVWSVMAAAAGATLGVAATAGTLYYGSLLSTNIILGNNSEKAVDWAKNVYRGAVNNVVDITNYSNSSDFLLRNGLRAFPTVSEDFIRIARFMRTPRGLIFVIKQNLLERQNVKVPSRYEGVLGDTLGDFNTRVYNPISTLAQVGANFIGGHINKQGLIPFEYSYYIDKIGFGYYRDTSNDKKEDTANNRLIQLTATKINNQSLDTDKKYRSKFDIGNQPDILISYNGGSGITAPLGIGFSKIRLWNPTVKKPSWDIKNDDNDISKNNNVYVFSSDMISAQSSSFELKTSRLKDFRLKIYSEGGDLPYTKYSVFNRELIYGTSKTTYKGNFVTDVNNSSSRVLDPNIPISKDYLEQNEDIITLQFRVFNAQANKIGLDNFTFNNANLFFRAYIENWSDQWKSNWKEIKYIGRGNSFYKYDGFTRSMQLSFLIPALSRADMPVNYAKLNALLWSIVPDYSAGNSLDGGFMKGNLVQFKLGDYIDDYIIINSIDISEIEGMGWDIDRDQNGDRFTNKSINGNQGIGQLPKGIKVNMSITPLNINIIPRFGDSLVGLRQSQYNEYNEEKIPYPIAKKDGGFDVINKNLQK